MIIQSKRVWLLNEFKAAQIEIENNQIKKILPYNCEIVDVDYNDFRIVPGFIDIHTHGGYGFDTNDGHPDGLINWMRNLSYEGVTSFLPTCVSASDDVLIRALKNVSNVKKLSLNESEILGIHLEGPYINKNYRGAHPEEVLLKPNISHFDKLQHSSDNLIKLVTIAPELDNALNMIEYLSNNNVVVSLGHSEATFDEVSNAVVKGAKSFTHIFNGLKAFHHRDNGFINAIFYYDNMYKEIICDGIHLSLTTINNLFKYIGKDYTIMVTDALNVKGLPNSTELMFANHLVKQSSDGSARAIINNELSGSCLKMNEALRILIEDASVPWEYAINSCTINPSRLLNIDNRKGKIASSYDADIVVLDDEYNVIQTYVKGIAKIGE